MRDQQEIEKEMFQARQDLETNLAELKTAVVEKVDVKARARVAVEKGKLMAADALERGKVAAQEYVARGKDAALDYAHRGKIGARHLVERGEDQARYTYMRAKQRPVLTASIIGAIVGAGVLFYVGRRKCWW